MSNQLRQGSFLEAPVSPLAIKATEALRLGDFKQAIELFKRLVKQDARPEWRDALAEAYAGRARILAAKGLFEEAETALSKAAAPDGTVPDPLLHVQCLVKRGQVHKAAELAVKYIGNDKVPAAAAPKLAELAAALWLAAPVPLAPPADRDSEAGKWVEHAAAAQRSLTAWIEGKPPQEIDQRRAASLTAASTTAGNCATGCVPRCCTGARSRASVPKRSATKLFRSVLRERIERGDRP